MPRVKGIFVSPSESVDEIFGGIVKANPDSQFALAAVSFDDENTGAFLPRARNDAVFTYDSAPVLVVIEIPVTMAQYEAGRAAACHLSEMTALYGQSSSVYVSVFRAMFPEFLEGCPPSAITPQAAYEATVEILNKND